MSSKEITQHLANTKGEPTGQQEIMNTEPNIELLRNGLDGVA